MPRFDLSLLDPDSRSFARDLASSADEVSSSQAQDYLELLIPLLSDDRVADPNAVALAITTFLDRDDSHARPLSSRTLSSQIPATGAGLEVLCSIARVSPGSLTAALSPLEQSIPLYADHVLFIIATYSLNPGRDPTDIYDLLFTHGSTFGARATVEDYLSLLAYLTSREDFSRTRALDTWAAATRALEIRSEAVVSLAYATLATVAHYSRRVGDFPAAQVIAHLKRQNLHRSIISFLLRLPEVPASPELVAALTTAAVTSRRASIALMKLAEEREFAEILAGDLSLLSSQAFVRWDYNVRVFGVVMWHVDLRPRLVRADDLPRFLTNVLGLDDAVTIAATILRRLPWSEGALRQGSTEGVWRAFFGKAFAGGGDETDTRSGLAVAIALAGVAYFKDLDGIAEKVVRLLGDDTYEQLALVAALKLSKYPQCARALADADIDAKLRRLEKKPEYRETVREIRTAIDED